MEELVLQQIETKEELEECFQIEKLAFASVQAAESPEVIKYRFSACPISFYGARLKNDKKSPLVGYIHGTVYNKNAVTDEAMDKGGHDENGSNFIIHTVAILPKYHGKGYGTKMLGGYMENQLKSIRLKFPKLKTVSLICRDKGIKFYERFGFHLKGKSPISCGVVQWFEMQMNLVQDAICSSVLESDLDGCYKVESTVFSEDERCSRKKMNWRFDVCPESFFCIKIDNKVIGFAQGTVIEDADLTEGSMEFDGHSDKGINLCIHSVGILPGFQGNGYGTKMMKEYLSRQVPVARKKFPSLKRVTLICRDYRIKFYERVGFKQEKVSSVVHGKGKWYQMVVNL